MTRFTPLWLQAGSYAASVDRRLLQALWPTAACTGGMVSPATGMSVQAAAAQMAIPAANGTGTVLCVWDAPETVTLDPAPPAGTNRIDVIICQSRGQDIDGGANDDFLVTWVKGTEAASPVAPAVPAGAGALAQVAVNGGAAAIVAANITDLRPRALAVPAVPPQPTATRMELAASVAVTANAWQLLSGLTTLRYNVGPGGWAGGRWTCGRRGLYVINGAVNWNVTGTTFAASQREFIGGIFIDAAIWGVQTLNPNILTTGTSNWYCNCVAIMALNPGQIVDLRAFQNGPANYSVAAGVLTSLAIAEIPGVNI